ncbi:hypothetical protein LNV09_10325 [Paucibacter sp. B2R-40]|uniref:hypothetical protein n=1 Tax=Paucibacter sp. B2R-40 TaxID=2893554 RepID=UPI0021E457CE|nr:hypothetical protein [Paucibacter sp. B2R-40]MCV2354558.1 hypothetical protein [Paucibacter sp. B2R-40]
MSSWITANKTFVAALPHLKFPLKPGLPDVFAPQSTVMKIEGARKAHTYLWCYLERDLLGASVHRFNPQSLSARRVQDLPHALELLSKQQTFENLRPSSVITELTLLSSLMKWADGPVHKGKFESILSDPDVALLALKAHHTYLRQRLQGHGGHKRIRSNVAGQMDSAAIKAMSAIHGREYGNLIEPLSTAPGPGVKAPKTEDVKNFMSCVQGVFDSIVRLTNQTQSGDPIRPLTEVDSVSGEIIWNCDGKEQRQEVINSNRSRLMEIGCIAFAALCLGDSGANLAQIQAYETPDDLEEQLSDPERITLKQKVIKFRAGGKYAPVHLTATSSTRLRAYLALRQNLIRRLDCPDLEQMFIRGDRGGSGNKIIGIAPITMAFSNDLRSRFHSLCIELPKVTMQQLRVHRQGDFARKHNPRVVADMTGNTVETAIKAYNKIAAEEAREEMTPFLVNLTQVVRSNAEQRPTTKIAVGECDDHGNPKAIAENPLVTPDCKKTQGCFFCDKYRLHADELDAAKLMSCRAVLERLDPAHGSGAAEKVYVVVVDRITSLLLEIKRQNPSAHERARQQVVEQGNLTRYWALRLQQLHTLGLLGAKPNTYGSSNSNTQP